MLIDWFTVLAQIVNFLILVWILKRFLYRPILTAIDARAAELALTQAQAAALTTSAQAAGAVLAQQRQDWERTRQERADQAATLAAAAAAALLTQARTAGAALGLQAEQERAALAQHARRDLVRQAEAQVFALARAALMAMGTATLERSITEVFLQRLTTLDAATRAAFTAAITQGGAQTVSSRFALPDAQRQSITQALAQLAAPAPSPTPQFTQAPEAIAGITVTMAGFSTSWNLEGYLTAVRERLAVSARQQQAAAAAATAAAPAAPGATTPLAPPLPPPSPPIPPLPSAAA